MSGWQNAQEPRFIGATGETERLSYRGPATDDGLDELDSESAASGSVYDPDDVPPIPPSGRRRRSSAVKRPRRTAQQFDEEEQTAYEDDDQDEASNEAVDDDELLLGPAKVGRTSAVTSSSGLVAASR